MGPEAECLSWLASECLLPTRGDLGPWTAAGMITEPPLALRGFTKLRSFTAFRQSEMIPCMVAQPVPEECKPTWETRAVSKEGNRRTSTGKSPWPFSMRNPVENALRGHIYGCGGR